MKLVVSITIALAATTTPALADRPVATYVPQAFNENSSAVASTHTIYLNSCKPNGCTVHHGSDSAQTDTSSISSGGHLTAFSHDDATFEAVATCMRDTFRTFDVDIVTTRPSSGSYLEVLVAGQPTQVGFSNSTGGVAPFPCASFINNVVVFDFDVWGGDVEQTCSTAAQEIAHTWALDHVTDPTDPMTYFAYGMRRYYKDGVQCGSDCITSSGSLCKAGQSGCHDPRSGAQCTTAQTRPCSCTGQGTQQDIQVITNLFGAKTPEAPTTNITNPLNGAAVQPGFPVVSTVTSPYGKPSKAELRIDGQLVGTVTSSPYVFNSPNTLADGPHTVEVTGYDMHNVSSKKSINVTIGPPCTKPSDCANNTDTCIGGRCVPGPGVQGGLGMPCTDPTMCASGNCASDGTNQYCVETCMKGQCPSGFGCAIDMGDTGVCWPGLSDGSSGGGCGAAGGGPLALGLSAFAMILVARRRRA